jgi:peroxiredoxin
MRKFLISGTLLLLAGVALANPGATPPAGGTPLRASPDFEIRQPSKPTVMLSSFKGQVVVMEFLFVRSPHCLRIAQTLKKLQGELGSRGFQPVGVVFDPPTGSTAGIQAVSFMTQYLGLTFPVGYAAKDEVDRYLGRAQNEILNIPQLVVIDRNGAIRATTGGRDGNSTLEDEELLRALINSLLQERGPGADTR